MNNKNLKLLQDMEIPAILKGIGIERQMTDLVVYDSLNHASGFLPQKPFRSRHFSVIIIVKGMLNLKVNLFEYHLTERDIIIIPPSAIREMNWEQGQAHFISLLFTPDFLRTSGILDKYLGIAIFMKEGLIPYSKANQADLKVLAQLAEIIKGLMDHETEPGKDLEVIRNLFKATLLKVQQYYTQMETDRELSGTIIYKFTRLLSENYFSRREVSFYSEKLHVHEKYLSQVLKKKTGKTARQYITEMIILEAKVLLGDRSLSIKQIADLLNFENPFHFSRFFKQYGGMPPTQYRKGL